jgi:UDP-N-acetylglucosamine acyltransferase
VDIIPFPSDKTAAMKLAQPLPPKISKLSDVHPSAEIGEDVEIGPFCVVGPHVKIGRGTRLVNNVSILGHVTLGEDNRIWPSTVIGGEPQDISYRGTATQVVIGDRNIIRECVTINRASEKEDGITRVGSDCYFMACAHVAHDCNVGDKVIIGQGSMLGGHVHIHRNVTLSGSVAVTHFGSVGAYAFVGAKSRVMQDIAPFMLAEGNPARPRCVNIVALKRNDFQRPVIDALNEVYRLLYRGRVGMEKANEIMREKCETIPDIRYFFEFVATSQAGRHGRGREQRRNAA